MDVDSEQEFNLYVQFLEEAHKKGKINVNQQGHLLSTYSEGLGLEALSEFSTLKQEFNEFVERKGREKERLQLEQQFQRGQIMDFIKGVAKKQSELEAQLAPLKSEFDTHKANYENVLARIRRYDPEESNPKLQAEASQARAPMDEIHCQIIKLQQEIDNHRFQIQTWQKELIEIETSLNSA